MESPDFTPRNVAKYAVKAAIHMKVAALTKDAIVDNTRFESDDIVVRITAGIVGWGVSSRVKPYTDKAVDKTADYIVARREAHKAKKEDTTPETEK